MITVEVPDRRYFGRRRFGRPLLVAVFSFRYDMHLVPDLLANIAPVVDGWISWDDRSSSQHFTGDTERRHALLEAAHAAGAQWILAIDPDERLEARAAARIRLLTRIPGPVSWSFSLRELYQPDAYRVDGLWGRKRQRRLFPIFDHQFPIAARGSFRSAPLHDDWVPRHYRTLHSGLNLYHLKMIDPARRVARSQLYSALDPDRRFQPIGYDYLAQDDGAVLETIPRRRQYLPPHSDDGGLWMADPGGVAGTPGPENA